MSALANGDHSQYVFVDLGCGKGRAVLLAATYPFQAVVGVELSPELATIAMRNVARFTRRRSGLAPIQIVCGDAASFAFPPRPLLVYIFNSFDDVILARVASKLRTSLVAQPRPALLIYHHPVHRGVLDATPWLREIGVVPRGVIYRAEQAGESVEQ